MGSAAAGFSWSIGFMLVSVIGLGSIVVWKLSRIVLRADAVDAARAG